MKQFMSSRVSCILSLSRSKSTGHAPRLHPINTSPRTFLQTIVHTDGSSFTIKTTHPKSISQLTKDTLSHPLWNTRVQVKVEESGQVQKFAESYAGLDGFLETVEEAASGSSGSKESSTNAQVESPELPKKKKKK